MFRIKCADCGAGRIGVQSDITWFMASHTCAEVPCCSGSRGQLMPNWLRKNSVVKDEDGNHFIVIKAVTGMVKCESVATREVFMIPVHELTPSDREVF